jgi:hypothetical protein
LEKFIGLAANPLQEKELSVVDEAYVCKPTVFYSAYKPTPA